MTVHRQFWIASMLTAVVGLLAPAICHAQIFQPGTQPTGSDGGLEVPVQGTLACGACHGGYDDADFEPWDSWRGSMMANAMRDPIFLAALAISEEDHPDAADFCIRCHSPAAWYRGRSTLPEWSVADGPRMDPDTFGAPSTDLESVSCMVCHRMTDDVPSDPAAPYVENTQIYLLDGADGEIRTGPYSYPGMGSPPHPTQQSTFLPTGEFCGECHDISNPLLDGRRLDGTSTGRPFAVERTYSEWKNSAFAARGETCQDCHMREMPEDVLAAVASMPRSYMRRHDLIGGNYWVPLAIAELVEDVDADGEHGEALARSAEGARAMLQEAAQLEILDSSVSDGTAMATIRVTNLTGHKLPTGYPEGRRMWLEVVVIDGSGAIADASGVFDQPSATLVTDAQLRTYETSLGEGTEHSFHFALNDTVLEDTRIPPEGFDPPEDRDIDPLGRDYGDGAGGYEHWDEVGYALRACGEGDLTLRIRLRYQTTTREYIEFLRDNAPDSLDPSVTNWGQIAYDMWTTHGGAVPADMAEVTASLGASPGACPEPEPDASVPTPDSSISDLDAGTPTADAGTAPKDDGGCGCRLSREGPSHPMLGVLALLLLASSCSRSQRRRRR